MKSQNLSSQADFPEKKNEKLKYTPSWKICNIIAQKSFLFKLQITKIKQNIFYWALRLRFVEIAILPS